MAKKKPAPISSPSSMPLGAPKNAQPQPNQRNTANPNYEKPGAVKPFKPKS